jgi:hypothetical protein
MSYNFNWLVVIAYRNGLIDRQAFTRQWENIQVINALSE